jgi:hypothetical protein
VSTPELHRLGAQLSEHAPHPAGSQVSLGRGSGDVLRDAQDINGRRPSYDSLRQMGSLPPTPLTPDTPFDKAAAAGSLRSILKDRNVPGTGRSVRFFSKDAFKIISPDPSVLGSSDAEAATIAAAMKSTVDPPRLRSPPRSVMDIFPESSPSMFNASTPGAAPTGDVSNFFGDVSFEHELPAISGAGSGLSINAFELADSETDEPRADEDEHTTRVRPRAASTEPFTAPVRTSSPPPGAKGHDRSQSFSFGQTLFHSVARTLSSASDPQPLDVNHPDHRPVFRPRAKSDTLFGMARTSSGGSDAGSANTSARSENVSRYLSALAPRIAGAASEDDIADTSSGSIAVFDKPEADPFAADAGTYYTPDAQTPPTVANKTSYFPGFLSFGEHGPPARTSTPSLVSSISGSVVGDGHSRTSSRDSASADVSLVIALRSQVAMQEQLARQFELDLAAKDELVNALQERLANTSAEAESRRGAARAWRKKVGELERACRALEERADRSAQDAMERSVLEEASGEALRLMHTRIGALESERHEAERSLAHVRAELAAREDQERALRAGILDAQAEIDSMADAPAADERARWQLARQSWSAEKAGLAEAMADAARAREALEAELDTLRDSVRELEATDARRRRELDVLQAELEAQWRHTEDGGERLQDAARARDDAESERDTLQRAVTALEARIEGMEVDFADGESRRAELEGQLNQALDAKDELERDREEVTRFVHPMWTDTHAASSQLEAQLQAEQARVDEVSGLLQQHEDRVSELDSELQYARETAGRLEDNMRARSAEVDAADERVRAAERAAEELHEQLSSAQREHTRALEQKDRVLADARADADSARADLAAALAKQAEGGVREQMDKDRIGLLEAELERLRRTVHQHQRESAAAEVKLVQLEKARAKDKEDLEGFNIALDSKQQEVEYVGPVHSVAGHDANALNTDEAQDG